MSENQAHVTQENFSRELTEEDLQLITGAGIAVSLRGLAMSLDSSLIKVTKGIAMSLR